MTVSKATTTPLQLLADGLRAAANRVDGLERENEELHQLCHVLARYVCSCPQPREGYREVQPECRIHKVNGLFELAEESRVVEIDLQEMAGRRHLLRAVRPAPRLGKHGPRCSCRRHGRDPDRKAWPGCKKHGG